MIAVRKIMKPHNRTLIIDLPEDIISEAVEVIIMPMDKSELNSVEESRKISRKDLCGLWKGKIWISSDFNEPLEDFKDYM